MMKCTFCGKEYPEHKGATLVLTNGKVNHLCSAKCRKNMLMKRRRIRWIEGFKSMVKSKKKSKGKKRKK